MAMESIAKTLGSGSGIDIGALVTSLVEAQFQNKTKQLDARAEKLEAQVSGVATLKSTLSSFDAALKALTTGGTLQSRITSSNEAVLKATPADGGAGTPAFSASLTVSSLASAQVSTTNASYPPATRFRTGALTLRLGTDMVDADGEVTGFAASGTLSIAIGDADRTLAGIAAKINAADAGVTARVIADGEGERLSIAGASGAARAFELEAADDAGAGGESLSDLTVGYDSTATMSGTRARDAVLMVDGVQYRRTSNTVADLVPGVKLELTGASPWPVTLSATRQTAALSGAVNDFVAAYNEALALVKEQNDPVTGVLRADPAVEALARRLGRLTTKTLLPAGTAGAPRMLADLGVKTARDGTLSVDAARLAKVAADFPAEVERIFAPADSEGAGLASELSSLVLAATSTVSGLGASALTYGKRQRALDDARIKAAEEAEGLRERMTRQFAGMDARVSAYKATQSFMDNQIKAWNRNDA